MAARMVRSGERWPQVPQGDLTGRGDAFFEMVTAVGRPEPCFARPSSCKALVISPVVDAYKRWR